ncbi:MAG: YceI family protein [Ferruginibacter sp.]
MKIKVCLQLVVFMIMITTIGNAQAKYFTKAGKVSFYSKTTVEDIEAVNNKVVSIWDVPTGQIEFAVLMKGFEFKKALMQEHFNENYIESDRYPKAIFKGTIENSNSLSLNGDKTLVVKINGFLTMHGVTNPVNTTATIIVKNGVVAASCNLEIELSDYKINVPAVAAANISKRISISVNIPDYLLLPAK